MDEVVGEKNADSSFLDNNAVKKMVREFIDAGKLHEADQVCDNNIAADVKNDVFYFLKSIVQEMLGNLGCAKKCIVIALKRNPFDRMYWIQFGKILLGQRRIENAEIAFRKSIELDPASIEAYFELGRLYVYSGRLQQAIDVLEHAFSIEPIHTKVVCLLLNCLLGKERGGVIANQAESLLMNSDLSYHEKIDLLHALGMYYDAYKNYSRAFECFKQSKQLYVQHNNLTIVARRQRMSDIAYSFTKDFIEKHKGKGYELGQCIFIIGMPRSGTSLLEKLLSTHSQIVGVGEAVCVDKIFFNHDVMNHLICDSSDSSCVLRSCGELCINYLKDFAGRESDLYVEKTPENYAFAGFIHLMLPEAKIIHIHRNPMDCCFSNYKARFFSKLDYNYSLVNIADQYINYLKIMRHWESVMPGIIRHVKYEELVLNPESVVRELFGFVGVGFEDVVDLFYKNKTVCSTASCFNVCKPVNADFIDSWVPYKEYLKPLIDVLCCFDENIVCKQT